MSETPPVSYLRRLRSVWGHEPLLFPSVSVLIFQDSKLLLVQQRESGLWVAPGGLIDPGETPADAAVREAWEETGLLIELTGMFGVFGGPGYRVSYRNGDVADYVMAMFRAVVIGGEPGPKDDEIADLRWVSEHEFNNLNLAPWATWLLPYAWSHEMHPSVLRSTWRPA